MTIRCVLIYQYNPLPLDPRVTLLLKQSRNLLVAIRTRRTRRVRIGHNCRGLVDIGEGRVHSPIHGTSSACEGVSSVTAVTECRLPNSLSFNLSPLAPHSFISPFSPSVSWLSCMVKTHPLSTSSLLSLSLCLSVLIFMSSLTQLLSSSLTSMFSPPHNIFLYIFIFTLSLNSDFHLPLAFCHYSVSYFLFQPSHYHLILRFKPHEGFYSWCTGTGYQNNFGLE